MADVAKVRSLARSRRQKSVRKRVVGSGGQPRVCVFRSAKHLFVQVIDDASAKTLASASTFGLKGSSKVEAARIVGKTLAEACKSVGVESVVFDRNGFRYHGRVKAVAEAAREGGLRF